MSALVIDGRKIAEEIKREVKAASARLEAEKGITPGLAFIIAGNNPASEAYVKMKARSCQEMGFYSVTEKLPADVQEASILKAISRFNSDARLHGILVQLPLPAHIDEGNVLSAVDYRKDVDGMHPVNVGRLVMGLECFKACTPLGIQELLLRSGYDPGGKHVVVLGRSNIVGKPVLNILLQKKQGANAVVTAVHTGAKEMAYYTLQADILIVAIGKPECIRGDMIKKGAVVLDVGINRVNDPAAKNGYRLTGDVHFQSACEVAMAITPVPGGVGPMTIAMLMQNTLKAAASIVYPAAL